MRGISPGPTMYLDNCSPRSSLKKATKDPLAVTAFRLQGKWPELPPAIRAFENLEVLMVKGVGLERLPEWLVELPRLRALDLSNNRTAEIPCLPRLEELQILYASSALRGLESALASKAVRIETIALGVSQVSAAFVSAEER